MREKSRERRYVLKRTIKPHREVTFVETAGEASPSHRRESRVDLSYMAQLYGEKTQEEIIKDCRALSISAVFRTCKVCDRRRIFIGECTEKLKNRRDSGKDRPRACRQVSALEKVIPKDLLQVKSPSVWARHGYAGGYTAVHGGAFNAVKLMRRAG